MCPSALPMGLEPNKSSDRTAAGCCRVAAMRSVRLSSATGYASTERRWCICKWGSCTIAHALPVRLRRWRGRAAGPGQVVTEVDDHPHSCRRLMARVHDGTITNGLSGRLVPGRWDSLTESCPSRAAPAEPSRRCDRARA